MGRQSKYPEEFRRQAAMLVVDGQRPAREVACELGVPGLRSRNPGSVYPAAGQHTAAGSGYYSLLFVRRR